MVTSCQILPKTSRHLLSLNNLSFLSILRILESLVGIGILVYTSCILCGNMVFKLSFQFLEHFKQSEPWNWCSSKPKEARPKKATDFSSPELERALFQKFLENRFKPRCLHICSSYQF